MSVHFSEDTHLDPDVVHVENQGSKYHLPEAHIGMLRNHHTYHAGIVSVTLGASSYNSHCIFFLSYKWFKPVPSGA